MSQPALVPLLQHRTSEVPFHTYKHRQAALARYRLYPLTVFYALYTIVVPDYRAHDGTSVDRRRLPLSRLGDVDFRRIPLPSICASRSISVRHGSHPAISARTQMNVKITATNDPAEALAGAHAVYTDVWTSMGAENEAAERRTAFAGYQVNDELFAKARPDALFMHCLPAKRGEEVTDSVMESPRSVVFDQAENRLHAQKALLLMLLV